MDGPALWPQLVWLASLLCGVLVAGFIAAWRIQALRSQDKVTAVEQVAALKAAFETRLASIEVFNAGTMVVLEHLKEFRTDISRQFEELRRQRHTDIEGIHRRLDAMHNSARLERLALETREPETDG